MRGGISVFLSGIILAATLSGCVTTGTQGGGGYSGEPVTSPSAAQYEINKGKAFATKNEVAIGGFKVAFVTKIRGSNSTRGSFLGGGSPGKAAATAVLSGLSQEVMQQITDAAYEDFKTKLIARGYRVRPFATIRNHPGFTAINTKGSPLETSEPMPAMSADALIFAPTGQKLRLFASQGAGLQGFGWSSPESGFSKVAVETGIPLLDVYYVVNFASFGGHSSRTTTSISVDQSMSVVNGSQLYITSGYGGTFSSDQGSIRLKQPIGSERKFASITEEEKSGTEQLGNVLAKGVAALLGGGTRASSTYDFVTNADDYRKAALDALAKTNEGVTTQMAALR